VNLNAPKGPPGVLKSRNATANLTSDGHIFLKVLRAEQEGGNFNFFCAF
jgi:hypothetical protein